MLPQKNKKIYNCFRIICLLLFLWWFSPFVYPVYLKWHVDFGEISHQTGIPVSELNAIHTFVIRFNPRFYQDPEAWEIMRMTPEWIDLDSEAWPKWDEYEMAVRIRLLSSYTGEPPSTMFISKLQKKRYFICRGYRFPPKVLEQTSYRPVVLIVDRDLQRADPFEVHGMMYSGRWESVDEFTDEYINPLTIPRERKK